MSYYERLDWGECAGHGKSDGIEEDEAFSTVFTWRPNGEIEVTYLDPQGENDTTFVVPPATSESSDNQ